MQGDTSDLVKRLSDGDKNAFEAVYLRYWQQVLGICERYIGSREEAAELTQDIFFSLWQRRGQLVPGTNLSGYLHGAAKNQSFNHLRNKQRRERKQVDYKADTVSTTPAEEIQYKELYKACAVTIGSVGEPAKTIFRMSREEQLSHVEIAKAMGMSAKMVNYHIGKTLRLLRHSLRDFL